MKNISIKLLMLAMVVAGCGRNENHFQAEQAATGVALDWLKLIDDGQYAESWEQSAAVFKNALTPEGWGKMVTPVREPLGAVQSREVLRREFMPSLPGGATGEFVVIQFKTDFAEKRGAVETVTPMIDDGEWKVSGYYIK